MKYLMVLPVEFFRISDGIVATEGAFRQHLSLLLDSRARKELRTIAERAERERKIAVLINEFILSAQYWHFASVPSNIARVRRTFP